MPRRLRFSSGGCVYYVLNRAVGRATLFDKSLDYAAFEKVLRQADAKVPMRLLAFCLMPNHLLLVLWPRQGRFESFPIEEDEHLLAVWRYLERNPLRAQLVPRAEQWRWSSLWHRVHGTADLLLEAGPLTLPQEWVAPVNRAETKAELEAVLRSLVRGAPLGKNCSSRPGRKSSAWSLPCDPVVGRISVLLHDRKKLPTRIALT